MCWSEGVKATVDDARRFHSRMTRLDIGGLLDSLSRLLVAMQFWSIATSLALISVPGLLNARESRRERGILQPKWSTIIS